MLWEASQESGGYFACVCVFVWLADTALKGAGDACAANELPQRSSMVVFFWSLVRCWDEYLQTWARAGFGFSCCLPEGWDQRSRSQVSYHTTVSTQVFKSACMQQVPWKKNTAFFLFFFLPVKLTTCMKRVWSIFMCHLLLFVMI